MASPRTPHSVAAFQRMVEQIESGPDYERPVAFALGSETVEGGDRTVLDAHFTTRSYDTNFGTAAVLAIALGQQETGLQTGQYPLSQDVIRTAQRFFRPYRNESGHPNIDTLRLMRQHPTVYPGASDPDLSNPRVPILSVVRRWDDAPESVGDAYLRLYALSERHKEPNTINLDGIFGILPNVVTSEQLGTFTPGRWGTLAEQVAFRGFSTAVRGLDKFPRMLDHVVPTGVRVADPSRVRLGAFLGEGTTVMHEGFVNFNAGTLGASMVEGRISQGVVVGDGTDVGGGVSIQGTLSGGGERKITIGKRCLLEANCGVGISLGDDCRVEAGLYVKATTPVLCPDGKTVKALELSGQDNMMFRRNARTGVVEMLPNIGTQWAGLNQDLHNN